MANAKVLSPDELSLEILKLGRRLGPALLREFHRMIKMVMREERVPQLWQNTANNVLHKNEDNTECGNYHCISLVAHTRKPLLKIVAARVDIYCEADGLLPQEQRGLRPGHSTMGMMSAVRRLRELGRNAIVPLFLSSHRPPKAYDSVNPYRLLAGIRSLRSAASDDRSNLPISRWDEDGTCSEWFDVVQKLRQGCVLSPLLFNVLRRGAFRCAATLH